jgi:hypothetical protein
MANGEYRKADKRAELARKQRDKDQSLSAMMGRLETDMHAYTANKSTPRPQSTGYYEPKQQEFAVDPELQKQVEDLIRVVNQLTITVEEHKQSLKQWDTERGEWYARSASLGVDIEALTTDLVTQVDGLHGEIRDIWEELDDAGV